MYPISHYYQTRAENANYPGNSVRNSNVLGGLNIKIFKNLCLPTDARVASVNSYGRKVRNKQRSSEDIKRTWSSTRFVT